MQAAKDSFFIAVRTRLQQINPQRTVVIDGESVPALLCDENREGVPVTLPEVFHLAWGAAKPLCDSPLVNTTLLACECSFRYATRGGSGGAAARGRELARMDRELMSICLPAGAQKTDYTGPSPRGLGTTVFWQQPALGPLAQTANELRREATLLVFFYPEGGEQ